MQSKAWSRNNGTMKLSTFERSKVPCRWKTEKSSCCSSCWSSLILVRVIVIPVLYSTNPVFKRKRRKSWTLNVRGGRKIQLNCALMIIDSGMAKCLNFLSFRRVAQFYVCVRNGRDQRKASFFFFFSVECSLGMAHKNAAVKLCSNDNVFDFDKTNTNEHRQKSPRNNWNAQHFRMLLQWAECDLANATPAERKWKRSWKKRKKNRSCPFRVETAVAILRFEQSE